MLQDTGYPLEVYMPPSESIQEANSRTEDDLYGNAVDWSRLKERWVGWGVESVIAVLMLMLPYNHLNEDISHFRIPGEQQWARAELEGSSDLERGMRNLGVNTHAMTASGSSPLPSSVHGKFPNRNMEGNYSGLLLKVSPGVESPFQDQNVDLSSFRVGL
jgi:hypothetical protein